MENNSLFKPFLLKSLQLKNRIVMAPMTRSFSKLGVPANNVAEYYRRRAEGNVGLILSEGTVINRPSSSNDPNVPHFYGDKALAGWQNVINQVHGAGGKMGPQLWHMGIMNDHSSGWFPDKDFEGPSGLRQPEEPKGNMMSENDIADTISAFGKAASEAQRLGFDMIELHGAHGYLIDQFFWNGTNRRTDHYGGRTLAERARFTVEIVQEIRRQVGEDFVIDLRISQWKQQDYTVKLAESPSELEAWLTPLAEAGVDIFHCSQRRFWEIEFDQNGLDLNLAGWVKKLTGKATITVGSIGLSGEFLAGFQGEVSKPTPDSLIDLVKRLDNEEFDLVAVGRPILVDPNWVNKIKEGRFDELKGYSRDILTELV